MGFHGNLDQRIIKSQKLGLEWDWHLAGDKIHGGGDRLLVSGRGKRGW